MYRKALARTTTYSVCFFTSDSVLVVVTVFITVSTRVLTGAVVVSVFVGGGTPFSEEQYWSPAEEGAAVIFRIKEMCSMQYCLFGRAANT